MRFVFALIASPPVLSAMASMPDLADVRSAYVEALMSLTGVLAQFEQCPPGYDSQLRALAEQAIGLAEGSGVMTVQPAIEFIGNETNRVPPQECNERIRAYDRFLADFEIFPVRSQRRRA